MSTSRRLVSEDAGLTGVSACIAAARRTHLSHVHEHLGLKVLAEMQLFPAAFFERCVGP